MELSVEWQGRNLFILFAPGTFNRRTWSENDAWKLISFFIVLHKDGIITSITTIKVQQQSQQSQRPFTGLASFYGPLYLTISNNISQVSKRKRERKVSIVRLLLRRMIWGVPQRDEVRMGIITAALACSNRKEWEEKRQLSQTTRASWK